MIFSGVTSKISNGTKMRLIALAKAVANVGSRYGVDHKEDATNVIADNSSRLSKLKSIIKLLDTKHKSPKVLKSCLKKSPSSSSSSSDTSNKSSRSVNIDESRNEIRYFSRKSHEHLFYARDFDWTPAEAVGVEQEHVATQSSVRSFIARFVLQKSQSRKTKVDTNRIGSPRRLGARLSRHEIARDSSVTGRGTNWWERDVEEMLEAVSFVDEDEEGEWGGSDCSDESDNGHGGFDEVSGVATQIIDDDGRTILRKTTSGDVSQLFVAHDDIPDDESSDLEQEGVVAAVMASTSYSSGSDQSPNCSHVAQAVPIGTLIPGGKILTVISEEEEEEGDKVEVEAAQSSATVIARTDVKATAVAIVETIHKTPSGSRFVEMLDEDEDDDESDETSEESSEYFDAQENLEARVITGEESDEESAHKSRLSDLFVDKIEGGKVVLMGVAFARKLLCVGDVE